MADEQKPQTPADRIAVAIAGLPAHALPEVLAGDVLAVCASVPPGRHTPVTLALAKGAAAAVKGLVEHRAAKVAVHPQAGDLAKLLEASRADAQ